jgi:hypothetical protein
LRKWTEEGGEGVYINTANVGATVGDIAKTSERMVVKRRVLCC